MRRLGRIAGCCVLLLVGAGGQGQSTEAERAACMERAEAAIARAPDKEEMTVTTSHLFKRDIAKFFCGRSPSQLSALELGVYHGHTTAVLAAIFGHVLSLDVEPRYLQMSREHSDAVVGRNNAHFVTFDSYVDDWRTLAANKVDVAVIDGDHYYEKVRMDAQNVMQHFSPAFVIFDDYGVEEGVQRTIRELSNARVLKDCTPIGHGSVDGNWRLRDWTMNMTEGMICARGPGSVHHARPKFHNVMFLLYSVPPDRMMRAEGIIVLKADGTVWTDAFGMGHWSGEKSEEEKHLDILNVQLPRLEPYSWEVLFNRPRSAFVLTPKGTTKSRWFAMRAEKLNHAVRLANEQFE